MVPSDGYVVVPLTRYVLPLVSWLKRTNGLCEGVAPSCDSESSYPSVVSLIDFLIRFWVPVASGFTHAAIVIAPVISSEALSVTVARSPVPSKRIAWPCCPATQVGLPRIVPLFTAPTADELTSVFPLPSFALQSPTRGSGASWVEAVPESVKVSPAIGMNCQS